MPNTASSVPSLKDKELDKLDKILLQLLVISRELVLANAARRKELLADSSIARVFQLCSDGATTEKLAQSSRIEATKVDDALRTLQLNGLVETYVNEKGETNFIEVAPRSDQWWVACTRNHEIVLFHRYISPDVGFPSIWGPFADEPEARAFANAHFPKWRC